MEEKKDTDKNKSKDKAKNKGRGKGVSHGRKGGEDSSSTQDTLVHHLARLVLSHQEQLQSMSRSTGVIFHFGRCQERGIVPNLMECSKAWKTTYTESPEKIREPLRVVLLKCILASLYLRVSELAKVTEKTVLDKFLINAAFFETIWDAKMEKLIPKPAGRTMNLEQLNLNLEEMSTLCHADAIERLKILKPMDRLVGRSYSTSIAEHERHDASRNEAVRVDASTHGALPLASDRCEHEGGTGKTNTTSRDCEIISVSTTRMNSSTPDRNVQVDARSSSAATLLPLMNDGTLCYINSTVNMISWACLVCPAFLLSLPATWRNALATLLENSYL